METLKLEAAVPIAKRDFEGNLVSNPDQIKILLAKEYKQRLRTRPVRPDLGNLKERKDEIFDLQLKLAESNHTAPWKMSDLDKALADLKNNKSRDHSGYVNEIFKECVKPPNSQPLPHRTTSLVVHDQFQPVRCILIIFI